MALADASDALNSVIALMCMSELSQLQTLETLELIDGEQFVALLRAKAEMYEDADLPAPIVGRVLADQLRRYADAIEQGETPRFTVIEGGKQD
jgi:hypothetical protein